MRLSLSQIYAMGLLYPQSSHASFSHPREHLIILYVHSNRRFKTFMLKMSNNIVVHVLHMNSECGSPTLDSGEMVRMEDNTKTDLPGHFLNNCSVFSHFWTGGPAD
jgi:hypothetical protein